MMPTLKAGVVIGIPCDVKRGPFSGEHLISFETVNGPVTGFVQENELRRIESGQWHVRAVVQSVEDELIGVWIRGSFFTTNGMATISREMALAA